MRSKLESRAIVLNRLRFVISTASRPAGETTRYMNVRVSDNAECDIENGFGFYEHQAAKTSGSRE